MNCYFLWENFWISMRFAAVVCWGKGEPWKVEEIQVEPPKATEVRVKMLYVWSNAEWRWVWFSEGQATNLLWWRFRGNHYSLLLGTWGYIVPSLQTLNCIPFPLKQRTRQTLNAKISQLNNAIDNVSSRLRGGNSAPKVPVEIDPEVEATM